MALFAIATIAFRPAPPPGTPKLIIDPPAAINYVYLDAVVIDTVAQVVFMASLSPDVESDILSVTPDWPIDSVYIYVFSGSDSTEYRYIAHRASPAIIDGLEGPITLRITYETIVYRALTGPPGQWSYGWSFAFYPPFEDNKGKIIPPQTAKIRFMLPHEMKPINCEGVFDRKTVLDSFDMWEYSAEEPITRACEFRAVDE